MYQFMYLVLRSEVVVEGDLVLPVRGEVVHGVDHLVGVCEEKNNHDSTCEMSG